MISFSTNHFEMGHLVLISIR